MTTVLIVSDCHGNIDALDAVLNDAGDFDAIMVLGDYVDYCTNPNEVISAVRSYPGWFIKGNHDMVQTGELPITHMHREAGDCSRWSSDILDQENVDWLSSLNSYADLGMHYIVHGCPEKAEPVGTTLSRTALGYISYPMDAIQIFNEFGHLLILNGHTHVAACFLTDGRYALGSDLENKEIDLSQGRYIANPGSVGQPRDKDRRSSYMIWQDNVLTWKRCEYDIPRVQKKIRDAGLPDKQAERLEFGQ